MYICLAKAVLRTVKKCLYRLDRVKIFDVKKKKKKKKKRM